ncbi:MAG: NTP transferase domain-containing protein [Limisphaerales bacterium]
MHPKLKDAVELGEDKVINPHGLSVAGEADEPVLVILAAGKGTRFGARPKCVQKVGGKPLARNTVESFQHVASNRSVCLVHHLAEEVMAGVGEDVVFVRSDNPTAGTAFATFEAFCVSELRERDPLLVITMGDRIVPAATFEKLLSTHHEGSEAQLTMLTAEYRPPRNGGKGRIVRDDDGKITEVIEEKDIRRISDDERRDGLLAITEGNCPLYVIRARLLMDLLGDLTNDNAQGQYYLTDIVTDIVATGGEIRTVTTTPNNPDYQLLCSDVTRPPDLRDLDQLFAATDESLFAPRDELALAAHSIHAGRPSEQVASSANQLRQLVERVSKEKLGFRADRPIGIGVSGGRLRIAFMHPDMVRFYGPAWQMPIGAGSANGKEQIVMLSQPESDASIHLHPTGPKYQESQSSIPVDDEFMFPGEEISDAASYEGFGTRMSERILQQLGYQRDGDSKLIRNNMRRPFSLVGNALASIRTVRDGYSATQVQSQLGRNLFGGARFASIGSLPEGGFSSSSAVTVATLNSLNALYALSLSAERLVNLACQSEYGTGVRAGSLDQATEQKGEHGLGTLVSSNPRDGYPVLGHFGIPADRIRILYPYTVERDSKSWRWYGGMFAQSVDSELPTTGEIRKLTGKAAEICALLTRLPLDQDYFQELEEELTTDGFLSPAKNRWVIKVLKGIPLLISREELQQRIGEQREWYAAQLTAVEELDEISAQRIADKTIAALFEGWREPVLQRTTATGEVVTERGVPLRAILAYLFGEVTKNFYLIRHPEQWTAYVTRSQWGDRCFEIDHDLLPGRAAMMRQLDWELESTGYARLELWLKKFQAQPVNYNAGLEDEELDDLDLRAMRGSNFFRGLALIDLAEAMLARAFGERATAVRVNAAGQGDFFQVHVDRDEVDPEDVKDFLRAAFYRRFDITPTDREFVELHSGGGATGIRLSRFDQLPRLIEML